METEVDVILTRLGVLERRHRVTQVIALGGWVLAVLSIVFGYTILRRPQDMPSILRVHTVEADRVIVRGPTGIITLTTDGPRTGVRIVEPSGYERGFFGLERGEYPRYGDVHQVTSAVLSLSDESGNELAALFVSDFNYGGSLSLAYIGGDPLVRIGSVLPHGAARNLFALYAPESKLITEMGGEWYGGPVFALYDEAGHLLQDIRSRSP